MAVPHGDMSPAEATAETQEAMRFWEDLKQMGVRILAMAEKPVGGRSPAEKKQLVDYLVLYRRVRALPR